MPSCHYTLRDWFVQLLCRYFCWIDDPIISPSLSAMSSSGQICVYCHKDHRIIDAEAVDILPPLLEDE